MKNKKKSKILKTNIYWKKIIKVLSDKNFLSLIGREKYYEKILNFINNSLNNNDYGNCLIIYGTPGTGKTHLIKLVINKLQIYDSIIKENIHFINCNKFKSTIDIFLFLYNIIFNHKIKKRKNIKDFIFKSILKNSTYYLIIFDEIDLLNLKDKKGFSILEDFINFECKYIKIIGISNDLKLFKHNLKIKFMNISPYKSHEMVSIFEYYLENCLNKNQKLEDIVDINSIHLIAKKVSIKKNGDIRIFFNILLEIFEKANKKNILKIDNSFVCKYYNDFNLDYIELLDKLPLNCLIILFISFIYINDNIFSKNDIKKHINEVCKIIGYKEDIDILYNISILKQYNIYTEYKQDKYSNNIDKNDLFEVFKNNSIFKNWIK